MGTPGRTVQTPARIQAAPWGKMHIRIGLKTAIRSNFVVGNSSGHTISTMNRNTGESPNGPCTSNMRFNKDWPVFSRIQTSGVTAFCCGSSEPMGRLRGCSKSHYQFCCELRCSKRLLTWIAGVWFCVDMCKYQQLDVGEGKEDNIQTRKDIFGEGRGKPMLTKAWPSFTVLKAICKNLVWQGTNCDPVI